MSEQRIRRRRKLSPIQKTSNIQHRTLNIECAAELPIFQRSMFVGPRGPRKSCKPNFVCALAGGENHLSEQPVPGTHSAFAETGAGNSEVPYLALHPTGFSVPPRLRVERWALTPPFHLDHTATEVTAGSLFSVALSVGTPRGVASRVYPGPIPGLRGVAPCGVRTFLPARETRTERFSTLPEPAWNLAQT